MNKTGAGSSNSAMNKTRAISSNEVLCKGTNKRAPKENASGQKKQRKICVEVSNTTKISKIYNYNVVDARGVKYTPPTLTDKNASGVNCNIKVGEDSVEEAQKIQTEDNIIETRRRVKIEMEAAMRIEDETFGK